ncbi:MAG TPA: DNA-3-methyladenine glycosylase I [Candidatus Dormibacteraeota bacterium]|nr:DNA-3-methyladenine glycosylase I [Candidatus Dormibacteraeota bacterium]
MARCWWADSDDVLRQDHDLEWGRPVGDDRRLFETLMLEAFQAGLSWLVVLRKRENFRAAFRNFEPATVARFTARDAGRLMRDDGIIRNRAKIDATINNARRCGDVVREFGSFAAYVWGYEPKLPAVSPALPPEAVALSKDLRRRGWTFVGPTTVHSFMESAGLVNDHVAGCAAGREVERERRAFKRPARKLAQ